MDGGLRTQGWVAVPDHRFLSARTRRLLFFVLIGILLMLLQLPARQAGGAGGLVGGELQQPVRIPDGHPAAAEPDDPVALQRLQHPVDELAGEVEVAGQLRL